VNYDFVNLKIRKLINQSSKEFVDWAEEKDIISFDKIIYKDLYNEFLIEFEDFKKWLSQRLFNNWLKYYFDFKKVKFDSVSKGGLRYYTIIK
jgi:hypothetical protein